MNDFKNRYTGFFGNRAAKTYQSLALIDIFFAPSYWKSKISTQKEILEYMNFHVIETSVLKLGNKSEAFLISPENKAFKGQF